MNQVGIILFESIVCVCMCVMWCVSLCVCVCDVVYVLVCVLIFYNFLCSYLYRKKREATIMVGSKMNPQASEADCKQAAKKLPIAHLLHYHPGYKEHIC